MAQKAEQDPVAGLSDLPTANRQKPEGEATGEYVVEAPPVDDATCDIPASSPSLGAATCDIPVSASSSAVGNATCDFPAAVAPSVSPELDGGTVDFQSPTEGFANGGAARLGDETCEFGTSKPATLRPPIDATQPAVPDTKAKNPVPARAGRYVFKKFHAKGGMGEVWLAEDSDIGRQVALKRILKNRKGNSLEFIKEARVTGQLEHPGVIPVHELSLDDNGQPYYVMKFVHGQTLKAVIDDYHGQKADAAASREVQWLRLLNIFLDLCQTIAYAHSRGVIHRDIKPDNVMVGAYGETLVLDWGLAKIVGEPESEDTSGPIQLSGADTMESQAGSVKGTPSFFAPEVASGKVDEVNHLSDVYLLGATLYNMITGRPPRTGTKLPEILELARTTPPVAPRLLDPTVPKPLDAICRKALAHRKADRYSSAAILAEDVQRYLAGEPVAAYPENFLERTWRWVKRHRTALSRTVAALLFVAVAGAAALWVRDAELRRIAEVQEEAEKRQAAQVQAEKLQSEETARQQIKSFRARLEEARFFAASANPVGEAMLGLDAGQAETAAAEALKIADTWGPELDKMPLENERPALKNDLYDLLLELAQLKSRRDAKATHSLLDRAASLQTPSRSYYRIRANYWQHEKDDARAQVDLERARNPETPASAMDFYLLGEASRVESLRQAKDNINEGKQAGIKALLARREALLEAVGFYRQALRKDPDHYWSHFQLGACYAGLGSYAEAAEALGACIALRPRAPWGYSSRGLALSNIKERAAEAEADLDHAIQLDPSFQPAKLYRAFFYAAQNRYPEAETAFAKILPPAETNPLPQVFLARGQMYMDQGKFDKAIEDFEKFAAGERPLRAVFLHLTRCYLVEGKQKEALASMSSFLKADDAKLTQVQLHERRGREFRLMAAEFPAQATNRREGVLLLSLAEIESAIKLGGKTATVFDELGSIHEKLAEVQPKQAAAHMKSAAAAYGKAIDLAPKEAGVLVKRGWLFANLNENEKARDDFTRAVEVAPANAEAHTGLGYTQAILKAPGPARVQANLALLHGGGDYLVLHNTACIFGALTQTDAPRAKEYEDMAIAQLARAIDLWRLGGKRGPDEIALIEVEPAFPQSLRARPEFQRLLKNKK